MPLKPRVRQLTEAETVLLERAVQRVARWHKKMAEALALSISDMQSEGGPVEPDETGDPLEIMNKEAQHYALVACFLAGKRLGSKRRGESDSL